MKRIFELSTHVKSISRGDGRSATAAAAYRACCVIDCEREGVTHDYSRKHGLEASGIVLPEHAPSWAADRAALWNEVEMRERNGKRGKNAGQFRAGATVAREFMYSFPAELSQAGRLNVAQAIARHLAGTHGIAADFAIHRPGAAGDERNYHCHMMTTTRRMTASGLGEKAREWSDLKSGAALARSFRAFVAQTMNAALAEESKGGLVHVEHRSFKARGSSRTPTRHQGVGRTNALRGKQRSARAAWERTTAKDQHDRHAGEREALKARHAFALATKQGDLAERERKGIAAIRDALARANAADCAPTGLKAALRKAAGLSAGDELARQARAAERSAHADREIAALKQEAGRRAHQPGLRAEP